MLACTADQHLTMLEDTAPGELRFEKEKVEFPSDSEDHVERITVTRHNGATGTIQCAYAIPSVGPYKPIRCTFLPKSCGGSFEDAKGVLVFENGVKEAYIPIKIYGTPHSHDDITFNVVLFNLDAETFDGRPKPGDEFSICHITVTRREEMTLDAGCIEGNIDKVRKLLEDKADINAQDCNGYTAFNWTMKRFVDPPVSLPEQMFKEVLPELMVVLMGAKANVNMLSKSEQWNALHFAVYSKSAANVKLVLKEGPTVDHQGLQRTTPLMLAAAHTWHAGCQLSKEEQTAQMVDIVKMLLDARADVHLKNDPWSAPSMTALEIAQSQRHGITPEIVEVLEKHVKENPFTPARPGTSSCCSVM